MALTEQQKAANKAAKSVRDKAHRARYKLVFAELDAIATLPQVTEARNAAEESYREVKRYIRILEAKESELQKLIAVIKEQIAKLKQDPEIDILRKRSYDAWDKVRELSIIAEKAVDAKFPDMVGDARYHATCWKAPEDVLRAMEEARNNVFGVTEKGN